jgi:hypothetical protein
VISPLSCSPKQTPPQRKLSPEVEVGKQSKNKGKGGDVRREGTNKTNTDILQR